MAVKAGAERILRQACLSIYDGESPDKLAKTKTCYVLLAENEEVCHREYSKDGSMTKVLNNGIGADIFLDETMIFPLEYRIVHIILRNAKFKHPAKALWIYSEGFMIKFKLRNYKYKFDTYENLSDTLFVYECRYRFTKDCMEEIEASGIEGLSEDNIKQLLKERKLLFQKD